MNLIRNDTAQAGGLIIVVAGLLLIGFFIVVFGALMDTVQDSNNDLISNPDISYSEDHRNAAIMNFDFWAGMPIYAIVIFAIWGIKNALKKEDDVI